MKTYTFSYWSYKDGQWLHTSKQIAAHDIDEAKQQAIVPNDDLPVMYVNLEVALQ